MQLKDIAPGWHLMRCRSARVIQIIIVTSKEWCYVKSMGSNFDTNPDPDPDPVLQPALAWAHQVSSSCEILPMCKDEEK